MPLAPSLQGLVRQAGSTQNGRRQGQPFDPTMGTGTMLVDTKDGAPPSEVDPTTDPAAYAALLRDRARNRFWATSLQNPFATAQQNPSDPWGAYNEAYDVVGENTGKSVRQDTRSLNLPIDEPESNSDPTWWTGGQTATTPDRETQDEGMMPTSLRRLYRAQFMQRQQGGR